MALFQIREPRHDPPRRLVSGKLQRCAFVVAHELHARKLVSAGVEALEQKIRGRVVRVDVYDDGLHEVRFVRHGVASSQCSSQ